MAAKSNSKRMKGICSVQDSWFEDDEFKHVIRKNHMNNNDMSVYCLLCCKSVSIEHQGLADLMRHMNGESHKKCKTLNDVNPALIPYF